MSDKTKDTEREAAIKLIRKWQGQLAYYENIMNKNKEQNMLLQRIEYSDAKAASIPAEEIINDLMKVFPAKEHIIDIIITSPGDSSVGIPDETWTITNVTVEYEFREKLRNGAEKFFAEYIAGDDCRVLFSDEMKNMED